MFQHRTFDVETVRSVDPSRLRRPQAGGIAGGFCGNQDFQDLRGMAWHDAEALLEEEGVLIRRIDQADDADDEYDVISEKTYEDSNMVHGLDVGVASTVGDLSAAGCLSFASCNAGALGGSHHEVHPLVAFCAEPWQVLVLIDAAEASGAELERQAPGEFIVYADVIRKMPAFAIALMDRRGLLNDVAKPG